MFDDADLNNDGVLEMEEFKQFVLNMLEALSNHPLSDSKEDLRSLFERLDKNKDGVLDWDEVWESFQPMQEKLAK